MANNNHKKSGSRQIINRAKRVLKIEASAIEALTKRVDSSFEEAINVLLGCSGKVVVTGMGKSGLICKKIAATFASTGTPAFFLHPAEGIHGDLGMISRRDVVLALSNSGETPELLTLLPVFKRMGLKLIVMVGTLDSTLARAAEVVLDVSVSEEACPLGLAPTASTTASLALGDALAISLLEERGFNEEDFASLHPGGALGKKLLRVKDLAHYGDEIPLVQHSATSEEVLLEMTSKQLGHTGVINGKGKLIGVITNGDLTRFLSKGGIADKTARDLMSANPKKILEEALAMKAVQIMENYSITALFVTDKQGKLKGIIHLHDILKASVV